MTSQTHPSRSNREINTFVLGMYESRPSISLPRHRILKVPPLSLSSSLQKIEGESKRGRHNQSMALVGDTSARTRPFPMAPWFRGDFLISVSSDRLDALSMQPPQDSRCESGCQ